MKATSKILEPILFTLIITLYYTNTQAASLPEYQINTVEILSRAKFLEECESTDERKQEIFAPFGYYGPGEVVEDVPSETMGIFTAQGDRRSQEDAHMSLNSIIKGVEITALGIFDGHGGDRVSKFAAEFIKSQLPATLQDCFDLNDPAYVVTTICCNNFKANYIKPRGPTPKTSDRRCHRTAFFINRQTWLLC